LKTQQEGTSINQMKRGDCQIGSLPFFVERLVIKLSAQQVLFNLGLRVFCFGLLHPFLLAFCEPEMA